MTAISKTIRAMLVPVVALALTSNVASAKWSWKPSKMFSLKSTWPFRDKDEPQEGTPTRMMCTWTDTILSQPGKIPQRGFGGRIIFYENDEPKPILVDGQFIVYAFDETGREPTDNKPTRRYVFPAEQIPLHMSKNEFGASYSFFLPWDDAGGPKTDVGLICRFEPKGGAVVSSEETHGTLPGSMAARVIGTGGAKLPPKTPEGVLSRPARQTAQTLQAQRAEAHQAQLASYETPVPGATLAESGAPADTVRRMSSTTINLPNSYQMPSTAAVLNAQQASAEPARPAMQMYPQTLPNQQMMTQQAAPTGMPGQAVTTQPMGYHGSLPNTPADAPNAATMPPATFGTTTISYGAMQSGPTSMMQQQTQPFTQMSMQPQLPQPQTLQQRMLQQQTPAQQAARQLPMQGNGTAKVTYPPGQFPR